MTGGAFVPPPDIQVGLVTLRPLIKVIIYLNCLQLFYFGSWSDLSFFLLQPKQRDLPLKVIKFCNIKYLNIKI
jgi:hypothetical protein